VTDPLSALRRALGFARRRPRSSILALLLATAAGIGACICWRPAKPYESRTLGETELRVATWNVGYLTPLRDKSARPQDTQAAGTGSPVSAVTWRQSAWFCRKANRKLDFSRTRTSPPHSPFPAFP
jgi:hypothetical protein